MLHSYGSGRPAPILTGPGAGMAHMRRLPHIKARVERLHQLTTNLRKEVMAQRDAEGLARAIGMAMTATPPSLPIIIAACRQGGAWLCSPLHTEYTDDGM